MADSIKKPVGKKGTNDSEDVKIVQSRLNAYISAGLLGNRPLLALDGDVTLTTPCIQDFQRLVLGRGQPDGKVDPLPGPTMTQLMQDPSPGLVAKAKIYALALGNKTIGPVGGISSAAWDAALTALTDFCNHPKLAKPNIITVVDFTISRNIERLWTVDLESRSILHFTWVAHGGGMGTEEGKEVKKQGEIAERFEDGQRFSSLGPYITGTSHNSQLGHLTNQPAMKVIGLVKGVNARAQERGVLFHGADYVHPNVVGNSWGCFATSAKDNPKIIDTIKHGSFVFAYHPKYESAMAG